jgi:hypothetical protein
LLVYSNSYDKIVFGYRSNGLNFPESARLVLNP